MISLPSILARRKRAGDPIAKPGEFMPCALLSSAAGVATLPDENEDDADAKPAKGGGGQASPARERVGECG